MLYIVGRPRILIKKKQKRTSHIHDVISKAKWREGFEMETLSYMTEAL